MKKFLFITVILVSALQCSKAQDNKEDNPQQKQQTTTLKGNDLLLKLVNEQRAKGCNCGSTRFRPAPALVWSNQLEKIAQKHSEYMYEKQELTHGDGMDAPGRRLREGGYKYTTWAENVAAGQKNEREVIKSWLSSPPHCANIMNPNLQEMGIGRKGNYWTQLFATPKQ
ncbi:Uncharacterized conserved protein YkwD, contains CAP (CSP/antigen 5/PR1) domain [Capnocytophaga haemolytica]|uniref:SCP-like extracellular protein n=1 Tax=Capnocytophaga haemolytica TaxID=45243 RepID=A0AAX2GY81_9FLAO|nr:CAP domain-containing protein [Capnocytophaga haemolytica]AMD84422.1 SCP-like extracellular protein [Capnocytophaga haemolytica]SFO10019.1 Uncharacterized conserved protein YkwD, contains CAP (CSP/antigen 5/PR1) domain [Capnocytophaga haemolytica]SNV10654.1 uncharacterized protein, YkwD family [Capnocytophaga haemolytica]